MKGFGDGGPVGNRLLKKREALSMMKVCVAVRGPAEEPIVCLPCPRGLLLSCGEDPGVAWPGMPRVGSMLGLDGGLGELPVRTIGIDPTGLCTSLCPRGAEVDLVMPIPAVPEVDLLRRAVPAVPEAPSLSEALDPGASLSVWVPEASLPVWGLDASLPRSATLSPVAVTAGPGREEEGEGGCVASRSKGGGAPPAATGPPVSWPPPGSDAACLPPLGRAVPWGGGGPPAPPLAGGTGEGAGLTSVGVHPAAAGGSDGTWAAGGGGGGVPLGLLAQALRARTQGLRCHSGSVSEGTTLKGS